MVCKDRLKGGRERCKDREAPHKELLWLRGPARRKEKGKEKGGKRKGLSPGTELFLSQHQQITACRGTCPSLGKSVSWGAVRRLGESIRTELPIKHRQFSL